MGSETLQSATKLGRTPARSSGRVQRRRSGESRTCTRLRHGVRTPLGSFVVPFDRVPSRARQWDPEFFVRPLRWHVAHLFGARRISDDEISLLSGWDDEDMLEDDKAA